MTDLDEALLEDRDDGIALALLAAFDDAPEPLPVVIEGDPGAARRAAPAAPARLISPLDDAPFETARERDADRAVAEAERLLQLGVRDRAAVREQIALHGRGRRRDAPRRAHLAPRLGEAPPDLLYSIDRSGRGVRLGIGYSGTHW